MIRTTLLNNWLPSVVNSVEVIDVQESATITTLPHICQMTTVHPRKDVRIFHKECRSLAEAGYRVTLLVNDGKGNERTQDIDITDIGGYNNRLSRILIALPLTFLRAIRLGADIYHFHDPELMLVGLPLRLVGKRVIYDVHEDFPNDIHHKPWIAPSLRNFVSKLVAVVEGWAAKALSACFCTTPTIVNRFKESGGNAVLLRNYPAASERDYVFPEHVLDQIRLCYAGTISESRGLREMMSVAAKSKTILTLIGPLRGVNIEDLQNSEEWQWIDYRGIVSKEEVEKEYLRIGSIGIAILQPDYGYEEALPIKIFEYMLFGLPVVCSHFKLWQSIVDENGCGISVDPANVDEIASRIVELKNDPARLSLMAKRGGKAVLEQYSWGMESRKLLELYNSLIPIKK